MGARIDKWLAADKKRAVIVQAAPRASDQHGFEAWFMAETGQNLVPARLTVGGARTARGALEHLESCLDEEGVLRVARGALEHLESCSDKENA